jgi:hypothetical protein
MLSDVIPEQTVSGDAPAGSVFGLQGREPVVTPICKRTARVASMSEGRGEDAREEPIEGVSRTFDPGLARRVADEHV